MSSTPPSVTVLTPAHLGQLLVSARKGRKLTQAQVGSRLNLSQNRISYLEKHADELSFKQLLVYCAVVGLQVRIGERVTVDNSESTAEW
ncbi:helix-turn-helix domain-containing protein [Massilia sp. GER05]|uniref:helix-turn-helix domain-containing protein n=1 Tax=Massilia sp. GER05 TaxID=3394605 RepID=UPI003F864722